MEATKSQYEFKDSIQRIDEILDSADASYSDSNGIPSRDQLTFLNGFYVDVTVLFVDMRGSKELAENHSRPVLAKIFRAYISEVVAVLRSNDLVSEVFIEGDGVWAVFNTVTKQDVEGVFETAAMVSSLIDILNIKLANKGYATIAVGIGIEDGESLYIKAGYKGSGVNEVVWIGSVVGQAANLCKFGNRTTLDKEIQISPRVYESLSDAMKALFSYDRARDCYESDAINILMNNWVAANA